MPGIATGARTEFGAMTGKYMPGMTITTNYGPEGNPNFPGTIAYNKAHGIPTGGSSGGTPSGSPLNDLLARMNAAAEQPRAANIQRRNETSSIYDQIAQKYQPGGSFYQAGLSDIERQKVKGVGQETQQLISSGLYGTTTQAGVGRQWEREVGAPSRLKLEDLATSRYGDVMAQKAGFLERINEPYPDYGLMAQLTMQAANNPVGAGSVSTGGWGGGMYARPQGQAIGPRKW